MCSDNDFVDSIRRSITILSQQEKPSKAEKEDPDFNGEHAIIKSLQKKVLSRLQYMSGPHTLNILRMINQGLTNHLLWFDFYTSLIHEIPYVAISDLNLNQLISFSVNYHQIKNNRSLPLIENREMEILLGQRFVEFLPELLKLAEEDINKATVAQRQLGLLQDKSSFKQLMNKLKT